MQIFTTTSDIIGQAEGQASAWPEVVDFGDGSFAVVRHRHGLLLATAIVGTVATTTAGRAEAQYRMPSYVRVPS